MIRVAVSAASSIVRAGLEVLLREDPSFEIAGGAHNGLSGHVDVVLADIDSRERLGSVFVRFAGIAIVLLADDLARLDLRRALQNGVRAVLNRDATPDQIIASIHAAATGLAVLGPEQMDALLPATPDGLHQEAVTDEQLTPRESQVLTMLAEGAGNREIAARLNISEHTVKFHVSSILAKLGAATRTEAVAMGVREGFIIL